MVEKKRPIIGLIQMITLKGSNGKSRKVAAKIDTGATRSSVDMNLAAELNLGPIIKSKKVKSAYGNSRRPVVKAILTLNGKSFSTEFTLADREHLKYRVLIGQNSLKEGQFLIDPSK